MKNKECPVFEVNETVLLEGEAGNIVYFKSQKIAYVCFSGNRKRFVRVSKLKKMGRRLSLKTGYKRIKKT